MKRRGRSAVTVSVVGFMLVTVLVAALSLRTARHDPAALPADSADGAVAVQRQDIADVFSLTATVTPQPRLQVLSPRTGTLYQSPDSARDTPRKLARVDNVLIEAPVRYRNLIWLAPTGAHVVAGLPIATLNYVGFGLSATLPPEAAYRVLTGAPTASAEIVNGPGPFSCSTLSNLSDGPGATVTCAVPESVKLVPGLSGRLAIRSVRVKGALVLPVQAVAGSADRGLVTLIAAGGTRSQRRVVLGATDGAYVEIKSGLEEGDRVTLRAPHVSNLG